MTANEEESVKDPVCGMNVNRTNAKAQSTYRGKIYYFCSVDCKRKFETELVKFVGKNAG